MNLRFEPIIESVVFKSCALHNYIRTKNSGRYTRAGLFDRKTESNLFTGEMKM